MTDNLKTDKQRERKQITEVQMWHLRSFEREAESEGMGTFSSESSSLVAWMTYGSTVKELNRCALRVILDKVTNIEEYHQ